MAVHDQANGVLKLIHNRAYLHEPPAFKRYCRWMGYRAKKRPENPAESRSIILKQKVEAWARQCEEVGFTTVPKLSRKLHEKHDLPDVEDDAVKADAANGLSAPSYSAT